MAPPALLQPPAPRPDPTAAPSSRPKRRRPLAPLLMLAAAAGSLVGGAAAARAPRIASVPPPGHYQSHGYHEPPQPPPPPPAYPSYPYPPPPPPRAADYHQQHYPQQQPQQQQGGPYPDYPPPPLPAFYGAQPLPQLPAPPQDSQASEFLAALGERDAVEVGGRCLAPVLEAVVDTNDRLRLAGAQGPPKPSIFRLRRPPAVTLKHYIERLVRATGCSPQCLVTALVYLDRVAASKQEYPSTLTVHRLLLAAVMLAAKHCSTDASAGGGKSWNYAAYAKASGLAEGELKVLEVEMLKALSYDLVVPPRQLYDYGSKVIGWKRQAMFRPENP